MRCPYCGSLDTQVKGFADRRKIPAAIRRRRICSDCGGRFTTFERVQLRELFVIKRSGKRAPFDRDKLKRSIDVALRKRSVDPERVERMLNGIVRQLEATSEGDIPSERLGELVMEGLQAMMTSPMCASPRFTRTSARRAISRNCSEDSGGGKKGSDLRSKSSGRSTMCRSARRLRRKRSAREPGMSPRLHELAQAHDAHFMRAALTLGERHLGATWPNPSVGAIIVDYASGAPVIVARGITQAGGRPHAERVAIDMAGSAARGATIYVTLEPCSHHGKTPPCAEAIIASGVARVVTALSDPDPRVAGRGHGLLRQAGLLVTAGIEAQAAARSPSRTRLARHPGTPRRDRQARPYRRWLCRSSGRRTFDDYRLHSQ